jgi:hypothetical protein
MSRSGGLKPKAVAGRPSVTKLTQSNWTGMRASGRPKAAVRKILYATVQCYISNNSAVNKEAACLPFNSRFMGSNPAEGNSFLRPIKIRSTPSFKEEVKPSDQVIRFYGTLKIPSKYE